MTYRDIPSDIPVTLFSVPKPFRKHILTIQRNAVQSWLALGESCEVILIGDDAGVADTAAEFGLRHIPDVELNEYGTPLINSIFEIAQKEAGNHLLCYINTDIILLDDFMPAILGVTLPGFLMLGRRWNLEIDQSIDFTDEDWQAEVRDLLHKKGELQIPNAMDYFVFPKGTLGELPGFTVGRPGWDNWLIYNTWRRRLPIVDATNCITAVHQNHDYKHVPNSDGALWMGPEARSNITLMGKVKEYRFSSLDATHILTPKGLKHAFTKAHLRRRWRRIPMLYPRLAPYYWIAHWLLRGFARMILPRSPENVLYSEQQNATKILDVIDETDGKPINNGE